MAKRKDLCQRRFLHVWVHFITTEHHIIRICHRCKGKKWSCLP